MTCEVNISGKNVKGIFISGTAVDVGVAMKAVDDTTWNGSDPRVIQVKAISAKLTVGGTQFYNHSYPDPGDPPAGPTSDLVPFEPYSAPSQDPSPVEFLIEAARYPARFASTKFTHGTVVLVQYEVKLVAVWRNPNGTLSQSSPYTLSATISPEVYNRYAGWRMRKPLNTSRAVAEALDADFQGASVALRDHFVGAGYLYTPGTNSLGPLYLNSGDILSRMDASQASGIMAHGDSTGPQDSWDVTVPWSYFTRSSVVPAGNISIAYSCSLLSNATMWKTEFGMGTPYALCGYSTPVGISPLANPRSSFKVHAETVSLKLAEGYPLWKAVEIADAEADIYQAIASTPPTPVLPLTLKSMEIDGDLFQTTKWVYLSYDDRLAHPLALDQAFPKWFYVFGLKYSG
jgi:hypothetical protein